MALYFMLTTDLRSINPKNNKAPKIGAKSLIFGGSGVRITPV